MSFYGKRLQNKLRAKLKDILLISLARQGWRRGSFRARVGFEGLFLILWFL